MKSTFLIFTALAMMSGCQNKLTSINNSMPDEMILVLDAHGGLDAWGTMNTLAFKVLNKELEEHHQIDLKSRKVNISSDSYTIGYDGKEVWVSPDKASFSGSSPRFYHNLLFYFYAMPFVLADPGIQYEIIEPIIIDGATLKRIKIKYEKGIGDAPRDEYILCFNPENNQMEWLFYTVTYFSGKESDSYNAIHYEKWQKVGGVLLPEKMIGYKTLGDSVTEKRYERFFYDVSIERTRLNKEIFEMPDQAEIDSLIKY